MAGRSIRFCQRVLIATFHLLDKHILILGEDDV
jgi:hypothetical protein